MARRLEAVEGREQVADPMSRRQALSKAWESQLNAP